MSELVRDVGATEYDGLCGGHGKMLKNIEIPSGQGILKKGTVLGKVTSTSKYIKCLSTAVDGSQTAKAVLAYDVDATSSDVVATAIWKGTVNREKLIVSSPDTAETHEDNLRNVGILLTSQK